MKNPKQIKITLDKFLTKMANNESFLAIIEVSGITYVVESYFYSYLTRKQFVDGKGHSAQYHAENYAVRKCVTEQVATYYLVEPFNRYDYLTSSLEMARSIIGECS